MDADGNTRTKPSTVGTVCRAMVQPVGNQLIANEQQAIGFQTDDKIRVRLIGWQGGILGAQSQFEWGTDTLGRPKRWALDGEATQYMGSHRTAHVDYTLRRY
ncbi:hypothetical protein ABZ413_32545 [Nocardia rhamnosiphila]|uniref:hypothetical protein n=1 Tax=Nocardia rhamnosiphila TaxID=426716 RepID=UPI0033C2D477